MPHSPSIDAAFETLGRDVLENLLEGCQVIDFDFRYVYVNEAVILHGRRLREQLIGKTMWECYPGIDKTPVFAILKQCMEDRQHGRTENEFVYPDGSVGWFELRFIPVSIGLCILSIDITDRKLAEGALLRTEEQLRHSQKMEAVGRLAGGVAHDFNNFLSIILSYTELMLSDLKSDNPFRTDIEKIHIAGTRAATVTNQLLAFSRQQVLEPQILDLSRVIVGMQPMLRRLLGADVELTLVQDPNCGKVLVDPGQMDQVILNLAVNARDAMPRGGKLTIETKNVDLDEDYVRQHFETEPGPYVVLGVSDTGVGMDKATVSRIFDPFFTTKERGKGTGLGLSTIFGIIKQSHGHIWVYSEPGIGTTFKVYLPRVDGPAFDQPVRRQERDWGRGSETILVVEDDDQVRTVACDVLRRAGYRVLEAANGGDALLICEQHPSTIHLLVTDVVLPRMNGRQTAERLLKERPKMKVLFMSGYDDEAVFQHGMLESDAAYLQKPLTPEKIWRKVREVLGNG